MIIDLIIPALNERISLPLLLAEIDRNIIREIIVVDNGSTDGTGEIASDNGATVLPEFRRGYGYACLAGISHVLKKNTPPDVLVFMDADRSDDPADLEKIIAPIIQSEADLVIGSRLTGFAEPGSLTFAQQFGNRLAVFLIWLFFRKRFTDLGPFRAIRTSSLAKMNMTEMTYGWTVEMQLKAAKMKLNCAEVPVRYRIRHAGVSKVSGTVTGTIMAGYRILLVVCRHVLIR